MTTTEIYPRPNAAPLTGPTFCKRVRLQQHAIHAAAAGAISNNSRSPSSPTVDGADEWRAAVPEGEKAAVNTRISQRSLESAKPSQSSQPAGSVHDASLTCQRGQPGGDGNRNDHDHDPDTSTTRPKSPASRTNRDRRNLYVRSAFEELERRHGPDTIGLLTLTQTNDGTLADLQRKFNSALTGVLRDRYVEGVVVRHGEDVTVPGRKRKRPHIHALIPVRRGDIRTGVDFAAVKRKDYRSIPAKLKAEWQWLNRVLPAYGLRAHLLPIEKCAAAVANYLARGLVDGRRRVSCFGFKPPPPRRELSYRRLRLLAAKDRRARSPEHALWQKLTGPHGPSGREAGVR